MASGRLVSAVWAGTIQRHQPLTLTWHQWGADRLTGQDLALDQPSGGSFAHHRLDLASSESARDSGHLSGPQVAGLDHLARRNRVGHHQDLDAVALRLEQRHQGDDHIATKRTAAAHWPALRGARRFT